MSHARIHTWILERFSGSALHAQLQRHILLSQTGLIVFWEGERGIKIKDALMANKLGDIVLIFS